MNNKSLLVIIAAQTAVMLGLLYTLREHITNDFIIDENTTFFLVAFSVATLITGILYYLIKFNFMNQGFLMVFILIMTKSS